MLRNKRIGTIAAFAAALTLATPAVSREPAIHYVTMAYSNGKVVVNPYTTKAAVGDLARACPGVS